LLAYITFLYFIKNKKQTQNIISLQNKTQQEALLEAVISAQEEEREKIATDLHDAIGINISSVMLNFSRLEHELKNLNLPTDFILSNLKILENTIDLTRQTVLQLYPSNFQNLGFLNSFNSIINLLKMSDRIQINLNQHLQENDIVIHHAGLLHLFRVCQEILNNIIKHSKCSKISIHIFIEKSNLILTFKNDGVLFTNQNVSSLTNEHKGLGLKSIMNRIKLINGSIDYYESKNNNFVKIVVPNRTHVKEN
jgi:signal transduction histidine kinase